MTDLLRLENICAGYGRSQIINNLSFDLGRGESLALLGRNGMGKTSLLATIMGQTRMYQGSIYLNSKNITTVASHQRARLGIGLVAQERDIFSSLSVVENLTVAARPGPWDLAAVYRLFPRLAERRNNMGDELSGGEQQMLAIARALLLNPQLLLLDEPLEGLAPLIVQELLSIITDMLDSTDMAVILVDQYAQRILPITQRVLVLDRGAVAYAGLSQDLLADKPAIRLYLGANAGI